MSLLTLNAEDVKAGDHFYMGDDFSKNPNHRWACIRKVKRINNLSGVRIRISAGGQDRWHNPTDEVLIERFD